MASAVRGLSCVVLCWLVLAPDPSSIVHAAPQDEATSLNRIKARLESPQPPPLTPAVPVQLTPTFKSTVEKHPFALTLEQELHKQFDLNALQRQSAEWASKCCGIGLGDLFDRIDKALYERRVEKARRQVARELAELEASRAAAAGGR